MLFIRGKRRKTSKSSCLRWNKKETLFFANAIDYFHKKKHSLYDKFSRTIFRIENRSCYFIFIFFFLGKRKPKWRQLQTYKNNNNKNDKQKQTKARLHSQNLYSHTAYTIMINLKSKCLWNALIFTISLFVFLFHNRMLCPQEDVVFIFLFYLQWLPCCFLDICIQRNGYLFESNIDAFPSTSRLLPEYVDISGAKSKKNHDVAFCQSIYTWNSVKTNITNRMEHKLRPTNWNNSLLALAN